MSTVAVVATELAPREALYTWASLGNADTGEPVAMPNYSERCVQVIATDYGSATLVIEGSLDGSNWMTLTDELGNALSLTSGAVIKSISEKVRYVRPSTSGGTGTDLTVILYGMRRAGA